MKQLPPRKQVVLLAVAENNISDYLLDCFCEAVDEELPLRFSRFWFPPLDVDEDFGGSMGGNPPNAAI